MNFQLEVCLLFCFTVFYTICFGIRVVSPVGRFALSRFALVLWVGRFALISWVVSPVSCFARELFRPLLLLLLLLLFRAAYCHLGGDTIQFAIQVQQYAIRFAISELL